MVTELRRQIPDRARLRTNGGRLSHLIGSERVHEILYSTDSREELAVRIAELEGLCEDAVATVLGWGAKFNELGGYEIGDLSQYPMATAKELIDRMHGLGYSKEGWSL